MASRPAYILEPQDLGEAQVVELLGTVEGLEPDGSVRLHRRICDTFDWRLHRAGLVLEADRQGDDTRLTLRSVDTGSVRARLTVSALPRFGRDLPPSPLRSELLPIVDLRALLVRAEVDVDEYRYRKLNRDEKTVSRVSVEHAHLSRNGQGALDLGVRVRVEALRGYDGPTERLATHLVDELQLVRRPDRLARDAVLAAGHQPDDFVTRTVPLDPDTRGDVGLARVLHAELRVILVNEPGVVADLDTECLHDFRVSVRRTRSLLKTARRVLPAYRLEHFRSVFGELGRATGPLRDLDVYLLDFDEIASHVPEQHRDDLQPLHDLLESERVAELERVRRRLESQEYRRDLDEWQAFLKRVGEVSPDDAPTMAELAAGSIARSYKRLIRQGRSISDASPSEEIHTLRKRGKELRYLIDSFSALYDPDDVRAVIKPLKRFQDVLGDFQDGEVQVAAIAHFARLMDERRCGSPEALLAMGLLRARYEEVHEAARADVKRSFEEFDRPRIRKRIERLTASGQTS